ncbi:hypothetical protein KEM48_006235 [Puccinia striiformis f. sp. tritici PST-130]|nr:hypothetical protein KEM48_006235 [Puccinia striiformis f. sp. tritici PST-130]
MALLKPLVVLIFLCLEIARPSSSELTYAPSKVGCPEHFGIRQGSHSIGTEERAYNQRRRTKVLPNAYHEYLKNLNTFVASHKDKSLVLPNYLTRILSSKNETELPRLSIAVGGGAYRGAIFAAGILNTLDGRNASSVQAGTGGLFQIADYITGLSGSAWLLVSWAESELTPLYDLVLGGTGKSSRRVGWFAQYSLFDPTASLSNKTFAEHLKKFLSGTKYWSRILDQVIQKGLAGFPTSLPKLQELLAALPYHNHSPTQQDQPWRISKSFNVDSIRNLAIRVWQLRSCAIFIHIYQAFGNTNVLGEADGFQTMCPEF